MKIYKISKLQNEIGNLSKIDKEVLDFFNSKPKYDDVISFLENHNSREDIILSLCKLTSDYSKFVNKGRANEDGFTSEDVDEKELKKGIEVEKEHTTDEDIAERIALDHLAETPDKKKKSNYYTKLHEMEKDIEKDLKE